MSLQQNQNFLRVVEKLTFKYFIAIFVQSCELDVINNVVLGQ